jgi:hypothetical protein
MNYAAPVAGMLLLLLLAVDMFVTVFHPEGRGGPVFRPVARAVWAGFRIGRSRRARGGLSPYAGPLIAALVPVSWIVLLVVGFALLYYPWILELISMPGEPTVPWGEALYHSLNAASTLGMGDVVAVHLPLRWLTAVQALAGFGSLTAALTYILSVYREVSGMRTLAVEIRTRIEDDDDLAPPEDPAARQEWEEWLADAARSLLHVQHLSLQYPILHYFRPRDPGDAFLLQVGRLLRLQESWQRHRPELADRPALRAARRAVDRYLVAVHDQFCSRAADPAAPLTAEERRRKYDEVLQHFMLA